MTRAEILAQAIEAGFTETQFKALTAPQRIAFVQAAASAKNADIQAANHAANVETQRLYRKRMIIGGNAPLPGETP